MLSDIEEYESLIEKIEILQDIQLSKKQINEGQVVGHDEMKKKIYEILDK